MPHPIHVHTVPLTSLANSPELGLPLRVRPNPNGPILKAFVEDADGVTLFGVFTPSEYTADEKARVVQATTLAVMAPAYRAALDSIHKRLVHAVETLRTMPMLDAQFGIPIMLDLLCQVRDDAASITREVPKARLLDEQPRTEGGDHV